MKSFDLGNHSTSDILVKSSIYLEALVAANTSTENPGYTSFHARSIPTIDVLSYLQRIQRYCPTTIECYLAVIIYLHRIMRLNEEKAFNQNFTVDSFSIHRLIITGVMISSKYFSDVFFTNSRFAKVGGIPVAELNHLEKDLLRSLHFDITVTVEELQYYGEMLINDALKLAPPSQPLPALDHDNLIEVISSPASSNTNPSVNNSIEEDELREKQGKSSILNTNKCSYSHGQSINDMKVQANLQGV